MNLKTYTIGIYEGTGKIQHDVEVVSLEDYKKLQQAYEELKKQLSVDYQYQEIQKLKEELLKEQQEAFLLRMEVKQLQIEIKRCQEIAERDGSDYAELFNKNQILIEALKYVIEHSLPDTYNNIKAREALKSVGVE